MVGVSMVGVGDTFCTIDELIEDMDAGDVDCRDDEFALAVVVALARARC